MNTQRTTGTDVDRNKMAALLSILPGLGHLYKRHYGAGISLLVAGNIITGFLSVLMALGTFGLSILVVPAVYIAVVAASAYMIPDRQGTHHYLHPWREREDEKEAAG